MIFNNLMDLQQYYSEVLDKNVKSIENKNMTSIMMYALVSKYKCKFFRENFIKSLQYNDKTEKAEFSKGYLDCYADTVKSIHNSCNEKFLAAENCLLPNLNSMFQIPKNCVPELEDLIKCSVEH